MGTVREDYSPGGTAWGELQHDQSRSRAYRWGEDGIRGISDDQQTLCFALAMWNGRDPILKERLFGLTNSEGNHGEDVRNATITSTRRRRTRTSKACTNIRSVNIRIRGSSENGRRGRISPSSS